MTGPTPGYWALLRGFAMARCGMPKDDNPYRHKPCAGTATERNELRRLAKLWRAGWHGAHVTRETVSSPGRGRGANGPRREWSKAELATIHAAHDVGDRDLAYALGRSYTAVRIKRSRLRKERRAA